MVVQHAASVPLIPDAVPAYWRFHEAVIRARLVAWLPPGQRLLVDVSGPNADSAKIAALAGHRVIRVVDEDETPDPMAPLARSSRPDGAIGTLGGRLRTIVGDTATLDCLASECADGVIAGDRTLSTHLAAEPMVGAIARVLRPGGRVLACVDSLVLGMAMLAGQSRWAHLADLPQADVVLVPWPDGTITRCYAADQVRELFAGAGLTVSWVRPLTMFTANVVMRALRQDPASMAKLVRAELSARPGGESPDESAGSALMVAACKALSRATAYGGRVCPGSRRSARRPAVPLACPLECRARSQRIRRSGPPRSGPAPRPAGCGPSPASPPSCRTRTSWRPRRPHRSRSGRPVPFPSAGT
jgi:hypothetical protein